ncbi:hypothetical protein PYK79_20770 [Streptomyces sp. ID05-04B]|uniref:hypothetical protein n=1 Tax=Streptomyces sp. ID05-04B TaxID=3028661 RepID=UPI0029C1CD73|nr:hypothetical protein [Streptomyces sp. ID05-04B]MDX5565250.1 hypothetical protein [Streptomyces sp. ID05-04B]
MTAPVRAQAGVWIVALGATVAMGTYKSLRDAGASAFEPTTLLYGIALPFLKPLLLVALADAARSRIRPTAAARPTRPSDCRNWTPARGRS